MRNSTQYLLEGLDILPFMQNEALEGEVEVRISWQFILPLVPVLLFAVHYLYKKISYDQYVHNIFKIAENLYYGRNGYDKDWGEAKEKLEILLSLKLSREKSNIVRFLLGRIFSESKESKNYINAVRYYQQAIDGGYQEAQEMLDNLLGKPDLTSDDLNFMGILYHNSDKVIKRDYKKAKSLFEKAIEKNNKNGVVYRNLGQMYENGYGIEKDYVEAAKYYQQAIERGYTEAQLSLDSLVESDKAIGSLNNIACLYYEGDDINKNYPRARELYEKAIEKGSKNGLAHSNLGMMYENGYSVKKDYVQAFKFYQQAIDRGYKKAQEMLDNLLEKPELTSNDLNSMGILYHDSDEVINRDYKKAKSLFKKAIEKNNKNAVVYRNLGLMYKNGYGIEKDYVKAAKYCQQAIDRGYTKAQSLLDSLVESDETVGSLNNIACLYYNGNGINKNYPRARELYEKAIRKDNKNGDAYYNLGLMYENGYGMKKNVGIALLLYKSAAENEHKEAREKVIKITKREECRKKAQEYYVYSNWVMLGLSLIGSAPSVIVDKIGKCAIQPIADCAAELTQISLISTIAHYTIEVASFVASPPGYLAHNFVSGFGRIIVEELQLLDPAAESTLLLLVDVLAGKASDYMQKKMVSTDLSSVNNTSDASDNQSNEEEKSNNEKELEVYYFGAPLPWLSKLSPKARHAGIIIKDPKRGLLKIELSIEGKKGNTMAVTEIDSLDEKWLYKAGTTKLSADDVISFGEKWMKNHRNYNPFDKNCRSFTDKMLKHSVCKYGTLFHSNNTRVNRHNFKRRPVVECEHRIKKDGLNA